MRHPIKSILLAVVCCSPTALFSQHSIISSGGQASGTGGSVTYTIGLTTFSAFSGIGGTLNTGLHHPFEISVITNIAETGLELPAEIFPNPSTHGVILKIHKPIEEGISFVLYDFTGRILLEESISETESYIPMGSYTSGHYFLKVVSKFNQVKLFKVIKK